MDNAFSDFRDCVNEAPDGSYQQAKDLSALLGETCDQFMRDVRALGLKADNCDLIYAVEAALYDYVKKSNLESTLFPMAEGFGSAMNGPARSRVLAQTEENLAFFRAIA